MPEVYITGFRKKERAPVDFTQPIGPLSDVGFESADVRASDPPADGGLTMRRTLLASILVSIVFAVGCSDGEAFEVKPRSAGGGASGAVGSGGQEEEPDAGAPGDAGSEQAPVNVVPDAQAEDAVSADAPATDGPRADASLVDGGSDPQNDAGDLPDCDPGTADCDGLAHNACEVVTDTDVEHCGACGNVCQVGFGATPMCVSGVCELVCDDGRADCDGDSADGCEADLGSTASCGACGRVCGDQNAQATCDEGTCLLVCDDGFADCNGDAADGCESELAIDGANCGWCGHDCAGAACSGGLCVPTVLAGGQQGATSVAVDASHVYFTAFMVQRVGRVPKGGGTVETLVDGVERREVLLDDTHVYLAEGLEVSDALHRFSKTGPFLESEVASSLAANRYVVDGATVYFSDATHETLWRVPTSGGTPVSLITGQDRPFALTTSATDVFWGLHDEERVFRLPKAGGTATEILSGAGRAVDMAADETHLYWVSREAVHRAAHDGTGHQVLTTQPAGLVGIVLDDCCVYFVNSQQGQVGAVEKSGGPVRLYGAGLETSVGLAVDDEAVYFTEAFGPYGGAVMRVAK